MSVWPSLNFSLLISGALNLPWNQPTIFAPVLIETLNAAFCGNGQRL